MSTILLADDDAIVIKIIAPILERSGFTVLTAVDGAAAVECARLHADQIDVLISDVEMPGLSGMELAATLTELRPHMKVLLISAAWEVPDGLRKGWVFLRKPFPHSVLIEKLAELNSDAVAPTEQSLPATPSY